MWDSSLMGKDTREIPIWIGRESGQRKRYLRSLEKELAAELGPDWRNVISLAAGIVWGPGTVALHLQHNGVMPIPADQALTVSQKSQDITNQ